MTKSKQTDLRFRTSPVSRPLIQTTLLAVGTCAVVTLWFGTVPRWPQALIPLSIGIYVFFGLLWVRRRDGVARFLRLVVVVLGAHLAVWLPFLLVANLGGDGAAGLGSALPDALVTALVVGWHMLTAHLWQTGAITLGLALLVLPGGSPSFWRWERR